MHGFYLLIRHSYMCECLTYVFFLSAEEQSQKTLALHNFETVYSHAMKLQVQVSDHLENVLSRHKSYTEKYRSHYEDASRLHQGFP